MELTELADTWDMGQERKSVVKVNAEVWGLTGMDKTTWAAGWDGEWDWCWRRTRVQFETYYI